MPKCDIHNLSISIPSGRNHRILFTRLSLYAIGKDVHIGSSVCPLKPVELICHGKPLRKAFRHRMQFICQIDVELSKWRMTMAPPTGKIPVVFRPLFLPVIPDRCMNKKQRVSLTYKIMNRLLKLRIWKDRKSTRLNSSHVAISYAVFCLKKKTQDRQLE